MPKDGDDFRSRRREREKEEQREQEDLQSRPLPKGGELRPGMAAPAGPIEGSSDRVTELIKQAEPLIEQVNSLYNQYMAGVERLPPIERRKQLEQLIGVIQTMSKPTASIQFRCTGLINHFTTHRERWDRMLRDLESGKVKRTVGPRR